MKPGAISAAVCIAIVAGACRRAPAAETATVQTSAAPAAMGTTLTPDPPPLCGNFGRPYMAPGSVGQSNPAAPPEGLGPVGPLDSRIFREGNAFKDYADADQALIRSGRARVGLDERAVYLASGLPAFYWNTHIDETECRIMLYGILGEPKIDTAIYSCDGLIIYIGPVQPQLPCWRLSEVAPRAIEKARHFDNAEVERQWEILHGLLVRGQTTEDVYISFGTAYRTGIEAREDGTNASQHVYLDRPHDAYALYLTFVDQYLRGWRFPPERQLTPEAEQRRIDAHERRVMDQMRDMEEQSMASHREQLAHMNQIQANQAQIRTDVSSARAAIIDTVESQGARTRGTVRAQGARTRNSVRTQHLPPPSRRGTTRARPGARRTTTGGGSRPVAAGCQEFTFNGETWSDNNGTPMGRPCGGSDGACPSGYSCVPFGGCMPENPRLRCGR